MAFKQVQIMRGGRTTKIHALVDGLGRPLDFVLTGGDAHDAPIAELSLEHASRPKAICADKAYDNDYIRELIEDKGANPVIPFKKNRRFPEPYDKSLYKKRNVIEHFFCRCKDMCRLSQRFDKLARNFLAAFYLFAIRKWINY